MFVSTKMFKKKIKRLSFIAIRAREERGKCPSKNKKIGQNQNYLGGGNELKSEFFGPRQENTWVA